MNNEIRNFFIARGLIHDGPMTYPPSHPLRTGITGAPLSAAELARRGYHDAARAKAARLIGINR